MSVKTKGAQLALDQARIEVDAMKARLEAATARKQIELAGKQATLDEFKVFQSAYMTAKEKVDSLKAQLKDQFGTSEAKETQQLLNEATNDLAAAQKAYQDRVAGMAKTQPPAATAKPAAPPAPLDAAGFQRATGAVQQLMQQMPLDQVIAHTKSASVINDADKTRLIDQVVLDRAKTMSPDQGVAFVRSLSSLTDADKKRLTDTISPPLQPGETAEGRAQMARLKAGQIGATSGSVATTLGQGEVPVPAQ